MEMVDFDKLLSNYLQKVKDRNPDKDMDSGFSGLSFYMIETAAKVCVSILKDYESQKNEGS
jgi:hypothetical protein